MVNENTRMYIPEENHQGKAGPLARPGTQRGLPPSPPRSGSPSSAGARPCGVARGASALPDGGTGARTPQEGAENSRPSPSRAGFSGACVSYEIPSEGEKFPKCLLLPRFLLFAWKAQLPCPPRVGEGRRRRRTPLCSSPRRGPRSSLGRGWERARAPRTRPTPRRAALGRPARFQVPLLWAARSGGRVGTQHADSRLGASLPSPPVSFPLPGSPTPTHLSTAVDPRVPTPRVLLVAPTCGLAPEDVSV